MADSQREHRVHSEKLACYILFVAHPAGGAGKRGQAPVFSLLSVACNAFLEVNAQRDRAISLVWPLLLEFPRTVNSHHGQLDAVSSHQAMSADPDSSMGNPWSAGDAVA